MSQKLGRRAKRKLAQPAQPYASTEGDDAVVLAVCGVAFVILSMVARAFDGFDAKGIFFKVLVVACGVVLTFFVDLETWQNPRYGQGSAAIRALCGALVGACFVLAFAGAFDVILMGAVIGAVMALVAPYAPRYM